MPSSRQVELFFVGTTHRATGDSGQPRYRPCAPSSVLHHSGREQRLVERANQLALRDDVSQQMHGQRIFPSLPEDAVGSQIRTTPELGVS